MTKIKHQMETNFWFDMVATVAPLVAPILIVKSIFGI